MRVFLLTSITGAALMGSTPASAHVWAGCKKAPCKRHVVQPFNSKLNRIHQCEAQGVGWYFNGRFDGGLQFHPSTWVRTGSRYAFAYLAPILEQKYRAVLWAKKIGWRWASTAGWPNCGRL